MFKEAIIMTCVTFNSSSEEIPVGFDSAVCIDMIFYDMSLKKIYIVWF